LIVCPSGSAAEICRERRPSHVLGLVAPGSPATNEESEHRLVLAFNDIVAPSPGLVAPDAEQVAAMLAFGRTWDGSRPLLVHCFAGISRSTAAAFALACQNDPSEPEDAIAARLRAAAPCATPNALMVVLADALLSRRGRMIEAVRSMGRGADYTPYRSFDLSLFHPARSAPQ
jgi:predicted protein tyrosine phosphatase